MVDLASRFIQNEAGGLYPYMLHLSTFSFMVGEKWGRKQELGDHSLSHI